jgi:aminomethyltransferase
MAYVDAAHSWPGNNLIVEINGRPIPARVSPTPFFDPENARIRSEPQEDERRSQAATASTNARSNSVPARRSTGGSNGS